MIEHDSTHHCFLLEKDGHTARLSYALSGNIMTISQTMVPEAIGGQGLAGQLNESALIHARESGWVVEPECSYTQTFIKRHPRFQDLVQE